MNNLTPISAPIENNFDYQSHFSHLELAAQAQSTKAHFTSFVRQTFTGLVDTGRELWDFYEACCRNLGAERGKQVFNDWLASDEFGGSRYLAEAAMALSPWYEHLPPSLQRLVASQTDKWSVAALKELPKLTYDLIEKLVKEGKQTAKSIRCAVSVSQGKRYLSLGELATEADWQLVSEKYAIVGDNLDSLRLEAQAHARVNPETELLEVKTDDLLKALVSFGYDSAQILPQPKTQKRFTQAEVDQKISAAVNQALAASAASEQESARLLATKERALAEAQASLQQLERELETKKALEAENQRLRQQLAALEESAREANSQSVSIPEIAAYKAQLAQKDAEIAILSQELSQYASLELSLLPEQLPVGTPATAIAVAARQTGETIDAVGTETEHGQGNTVKYAAEPGFFPDQAAQATNLALNFPAVGGPNQTVELEAENQNLGRRIQELEVELASYKPKRDTSVPFAKNRHQRQKPRGFAAAVKK